MMFMSTDSNTSRDLALVMKESFFSKPFFSPYHNIEAATVLHSLIDVQNGWESNGAMWEEDLVTSCFSYPLFFSYDQIWTTYDSLHRWLVWYGKTIIRPRRPPLSLYCYLVSLYRARSSGRVSLYHYLSRAETQGNFDGSIFDDNGWLIVLWIKSGKSFGYNTTSTRVFNFGARKSFIIAVNLYLVLYLMITLILIGYVVFCSTSKLHIHFFPSTYGKDRKAFDFFFWQISEQRTLQPGFRTVLRLKMDHGTFFFCGCINDTRQPTIYSSWKSPPFLWKYNLEPLFLISGCRRAPISVVCRSKKVRA